MNWISKKVSDVVGDVVGSNPLNLRSTDASILVKTGDTKGAGTNANIKLIIHGEDNKKSPEIKLSCLWKNDFEAGQTDKFPINFDLSATCGDIKMIEVWRDNRVATSDWFCEVITIEEKVPEKKLHQFPMLRWVKANRHYLIKPYNTCLPQFDTQGEERKADLVENQKVYEYTQEEEGMPSQIKNLPADEQFSCDYKFDIGKMTGELALKGALKVVDPRWPWKRVDDIKTIYSDKEPFLPPKSIEFWQNDDHFGAQRVKGCNPTSIQLCTEIPEKLGVTAEMLNPLLGNLTLEEALESKRLFMVDYKILQNIGTADNRIICAPIALFFLTDDQKLMPVAIQLYQSAATYNPVFLPSDPPGTWLLAKMWFNHADCSYHQSLSHLGFTHLLMEGFSICAHRHLAQNHPIFKLLAPHFLYLMAINKLAVVALVAPGGWVDKTMTIGRVGMFALVKRGFLDWRMDTHGSIKKDMERRGVLDEHVLPNYPYRDDGLLVYDAIKDYVTKIVNHYYDSPENIKEDWELQRFAKELGQPREEGGVGINGVPGGGAFDNADDIIETCTAIIFASSAQHAAVNFNQYDEYGFPPNYPASLNGKPPSDKSAIQEEDIISYLPNKRQTLDAVLVTKLLSEKGTNSLGDWELRYQYDPIARQAEDEFRDELQKISKTIKERNEARDKLYNYSVLDPEVIPNAISI